MNDLSSDESDESDDGEWVEMMEDNDAEHVKCLFCDNWFTGDTPKVLEHCETVHGFSFRDIKHKHGKTSGCVG